MRTNTEQALAAFALPEVEPSAAFPWGIHVCNLRHPKTGETCPGYLPTSSGGVLISFSPERANDANLTIEHIVVQLLTQLPVQLASKRANVNVLDFSIHNRFPALSILSATKRFKTYHFAGDAGAYLERLERSCVERHHNKLGGFFTSLSDFNRQAKIPEPYSIVIVNLDDFPTNSATIAKLEKVLAAAFEAGFYFVFSRNESISFPESDAEKRFEFLSVVKARYPELVFNKDKTDRKVSIRDNTEASTLLLKVCAEYGLSLEKPISDSAEVIRAMRHRESNEKMALPGERTNFLSVPVGRTEDECSELSFELGDKIESYHAFIIGTTGTGKSVLLDQIIMGIARNYSPNAIRLWLADFKEGTGFNRFKTHPHPNCEKLVLDIHDIDAVMNVISEFERHIMARGALFKAAGAVDLPDYNAKNSQAKLPYLILIIDEIHKLEKLKGSGRALESLDNVARQGRSFGMGMILATQTLANSTPAMRNLLTQFNQRIAFRVESADSSRFFEFKNDAPRGLRNHYCIFNQNMGAPDANVVCHVNPPTDISELDLIMAQIPLDSRVTLEVIDSDGSASNDAMAGGGTGAYSDAPIGAGTDASNGFARWGGNNESTRDDALRGERVNSKNAPKEGVAKKDEPRWVRDVPGADDDSVSPLQEGVQDKFNRVAWLSDTSYVPPKKAS